MAVLGVHDMTTNPTSMRRLKVLAVASAGGHWIQLRRLAPAFDEQDVFYVTTNAGYQNEVAPHRFAAVCDASRWTKIGLARQAIQVAKIVFKDRPNVVVTTGAACGFFAVLFGKMLGARTAWVDSIANVEEMSMSGRWARRFSDLYLTQWPHLVRVGGPSFKGSVL